MADAVILDALRTPIGRYGGVLSTVRPDDLAAHVVRAAVDRNELNEAFASQVLASARELGFDHEKLNVNGGAIAIGHPLGCSGARLLGTLAWELRRRGARYGVATMCIGVGQGMAAVIENPST